MAIKETMDVLDAVEVSIKTLKEAVADGSLGFTDIFKVGPVVVAWKDALVGVTDISNEIHGVTNDDLVKVFNKLAEIGVAINELIQAWPKPAIKTQV